MNQEILEAINKINIHLNEQMKQSNEQMKQSNDQMKQSNEQMNSRMDRLSNDLKQNQQLVQTIDHTTINIKYIPVRVFLIYPQDNQAIIKYIEKRENINPLRVATLRSFSILFYSFLFFFIFSND